FTRADDQRGGGPAGPVAVISYGYWQRQFGGTLDVIGQSLPLNGVPFTIVGVTSPEFFGLEVGRTFDVIVPLRTEALIRGSDSVLDSAASNYLSVVARLERGQSPDAAALELRRVQSEIREATLEPWEKEVRDRYLTSPFTVVPAATGFSNLRQNYQRPLVIVAVVVALVLLIGCVNVANLLLARAMARAHQLSVQVALGASRWRLARQLFAESLMLSATAAALGVLIGAFGSRLLVDQFSTPTTAVFLDLAIGGRALGFTTAVVFITALLFGTAPAFWAARTQPTDVLKAKGRSSAPGRSMACLVALQVALSLVLLVGAGLFIRSFGALAGRELGFRPEQMLVATIDPQRAKVDSAERVALYERARQAVLRLPNVVDAGISHLTPVGGGGFTPAVEMSTPTGATRVEANAEAFGNLISPGWFGTFGTPIRVGRDFTDADRHGAPRVAIVNETFARMFLGEVNPLGRTLTIYPNTPRALQLQIVGVAADAIYSSPREPAPATWYVPIAQFEVPGFPFASARLS
ncbi:MAG: ABC transporter permease, partial [Vicinamibacterales bacterium]